MKTQYLVLVKGRLSSLGVEFPYKDKRCYVLSRTKNESSHGVIFYNKDPKSLIEELKKNTEKDIYLEGGAEVIHDLRKKCLIDEYIISIIPILLGSGISLFTAIDFEERLALINCQTYSSGLVQLSYRPHHHLSVI